MHGDRLQSPQEGSPALGGLAPHVRSDLSTGSQQAAIGAGDRSLRCDTNTETRQVSLGSLLQQSWGPEVEQGTNLRMLWGCFFPPPSN